MANNNNLHRAKKVQDDEFYTQYEDVEKEVAKYKGQLQGKVVYCNCDNPRWSNFVKFFRDNFREYGLKELVCSYISRTDQAEIYRYDGIRTTITELLGNGDFRSKECRDLLQEADVVITNPPFSLFREYVGQLIDANKDFLIIGSKNVVTNKDFFPYIQQDRIRLGYNFGRGTMWFLTPAGGNKLRSVASYWYTTLNVDKSSQGIQLSCEYDSSKYPKYDNYKAINVGKVKDIPRDYAGIMGVPITFLDKYDPEQFEVIWEATGNTRSSAPKDILQRLGYKQHPEDRGGCGVIDGKRVYSRIFIQAK